MKPSIVLLLCLMVGACGAETPDPGVADGAGTTAALATAAAESASTPEMLYGARCAACHDDGHNKRAPTREALAKLSSAHIVFAMSNGSMRTAAEGLDTSELLTLAEYIGGNREVYEPPAAAFCANAEVDATAAFVGWGVDLANTAALAPGASEVTAASVADLELAWAFGLPDTANARSQPVLSADTLFLAATSGHLFALDRASGCLRWHEQPPAPPRTALTLGETRQGGEAVPTLFFGDVDAHVVAVDVRDGSLLWRHEARPSEHSFLTGAIVQHEQRLIVPVSLMEVALAADPEYECCRSQGAVLALDASSGARLWTTPTAPPAAVQGETSLGVKRWGPSGVPVWSTPTIDAGRGLVYVGTGQNASQPATELSDAVLALDLETGERLWHFQALAGDAYNMACDMRPPGPNCPKWRGPDHDIGAAVILTQNADGKDLLLVGQKSGDVYALDPDDNGALLWQARPGAGSLLGGVHWGMAVSDGRLFVPVSDPAFPIPGYRPRPGLYALDVSTGRQLWAAAAERDCEISFFEYYGREVMYPECSFFYGHSAPALVVNDLVFAPTLDGVVRAFRASDGAPRWTFDTLRPFDTVNGVEAHGGSIDVAGVTAADDMIFVQSGYALFGQLPGNVLLAFRLRNPSEALTSL